LRFDIRPIAGSVLRHTVHQEEGLMENKHMSSGIFETLRARCSQCGEAAARHPYCVGCGVPQACENKDGWVQDSAKLRCPDCAQAANG
jgi:hypothetical protein